MDKTGWKAKMCTFWVTEKVCIWISPDSVTTGPPDWLEGCARVVCETVSDIIEREGESRLLPASHEECSQQAVSIAWTNLILVQQLIDHLLSHNRQTGGVHVKDEGTWRHHIWFVFYRTYPSNSYWVLLHSGVQSHLCPWSCEAGADSWKWGRTHEKGPIFVWRG